MEKYIVGGAVRDIVRLLLSLNKPLIIKKPKSFMKEAGINDIDWVVVGETVESMKEKGFIQVGKSFPVFLKYGEEFALARTEKKVALGHHGVECDTQNVPLEKDLERRDFTWNGMAIGENGEIIDLFGGVQDLVNRIVRHIGPAFIEDPLRALRAAQFASRFEFTVAKETIELSKTLKEEVRTLSQERIFKEMKKGLSGKKPSVFFRVLKEMELLEVAFPQVFAMIGIPQRADFHSEGDVFEHSMMVLDRVAELTKDIEVRFAALFHDIAKPFSFEETGTLHLHTNEDIVLKLFEEMKVNQKVPKSFIKTAKQAALFHHFVHDFNKMTAKKIRKKMDNKHFPKNVSEMEKLLLVAEADQIGRIISKNNEFISFEDKEKLLNGEHLEAFFIPEKEDTQIIMDTFKAVKEKINIPKDIIKNVNKIQDYLIKTKIERINKIIK